MKHCRKHRELTLISSDGVHKLHLRIVFAHLLNYLSSLKGQFICRRHTQALRKRERKIYFIKP